MIESILTGFEFSLLPKLKKFHIAIFLFLILVLSFLVRINSYHTSTDYLINNSTSIALSLIVFVQIFSLTQLRFLNSMILLSMLILNIVNPSFQLIGVLFAAIIVQKSEQLSLNTVYSLMTFCTFSFLFNFNYGDIVLPLAFLLIFLTISSPQPASEPFYILTLVLIRFLFSHTEHLSTLSYFWQIIAIYTLISFFSNLKIMRLFWLILIFSDPANVYLGSAVGLSSLFILYVANDQNINKLKSSRLWLSFFALIFLFQLALSFIYGYVALFLSSDFSILKWLLWLMIEAVMVYQVVDRVVENSRKEVTKLNINKLTYACYILVLILNILIINKVQLIQISDTFFWLISIGFLLCLLVIYDIFTLRIIKRIEGSLNPICESLYLPSIYNLNIFTFLRLTNSIFEIFILLPKLLKLIYQFLLTVIDDLFNLIKENFSEEIFVFSLLVALLFWGLSAA